ncbi:MAG: type II toxin-antitoxin system RelE/ParE family toxin [Prolixibacteraceae bacterium]|jgi:mRNA interferase RelE/StbE|nr:type II toxin-antitoxin system RelE/ParE family toxin [Prolixibacteraceae bacterium]MBT6004979.1 type II toxin-antitoxin system RelE/ParE family toxin [Prolixibacteraceae bacterium]MBT6765520.1 type II toxin-antitoxin system RelE/ParE family toxin [Prolixibacteraceae bacterium]MBT7000090.1 type II toxin-antitoxin system RelE/ParE family toxin [Prolixibacteraceae bacterium]MBT7395086.1 type II toxin-antitoxin system RelE/ParE family toxin [Prolixibacteraceae bacterium]
MNYEVEIIRSAVKQLENLSRTDYLAVKSKIISLSVNPRPKGCIKLKGRPAYRIRQGNFRIIYDIFDNTLSVRVIVIGNRKEVYR